MIRDWRLAACIVLLTAPAGVRTQHYSWWSDDPQPYLTAIEKFSPAAPSDSAPRERVCAGIVTHHFLASGLMVRFFVALSARSSPETVILIGPNHYHHGLANISLSSLPWKTPFGLLETDRRIVQQIEAGTNLPEDPEAFTGEHSVGVLIPFLKYYFPHCRVVPILVDVNAQENRLQELHAVLAELLCNPRMLVLLSMDFSHDSVASLADSRDEESRRAISSFDLSRAREASVDCRKGLWLLLASLRDLGHVTVDFTAHTNSARLTGNPNQPDVTSYFSVLFFR